jgi:lysylphosphatidylglycerol synthetase-like protein (DUF2156 family)
MKPETRDNLIYLSVGCTIAALVAYEAFYSERHGLRMWQPTNFEFNFIANLFVLEYLVVTQTRKLRATRKQIFTFVVAAGVLHAAVLLSFPGPFSGKAYTALPAGILELTIITLLMVWAARRISTDRT